MWFKNLLIYGLAPGWKMAPGTLEEKLSKHPLQPCKGLNTRTRGWLPPRGEGALVCSQERHMLITMGVEEKMLPSAVVRQAVIERAAALEKQKGFKPGRKQLRDLKDQVVSELLPRAFARRRSVNAWLDPKGGWLVIDSSSPARGELLLELLRDSLDDSPWLAMDWDHAPSDLMTRWLSAAQPPKPFGLGDECELSGKDAQNSPKAQIRYIRHELEGDDMRRHLGNGKRATKLKLTWNDRMTFVLHEKLQVKRLGFLGMKETREEAAVQDPDEQFDAEFTLMCGEVGELLAGLGKVLGLRPRAA